MRDWIVRDDGLDRLLSAEGKPSLKQFETIRPLGGLDGAQASGEMDRDASETSPASKKTGLARRFKAQRGRGSENVREDRFGDAARPAGGCAATTLCRPRA